GPASVFYWNSISPIFGRAVQNPGNTGYFVTNDAAGDATMASVSFSFADSPLLFTVLVPHLAVPNADYSSDTGFADPARHISGDDWANRKPITGDAIGGATIAGIGQDQLWLAWTGGRKFAGATSNAWSQPHVHYVGYRLPGFTPIRESDLFNSNYAIE